MAETKPSPIWTLRPHLGMGAGNPGSSIAGEEGLEKVTLVVSAPGLGSRIEVPRNEFLATVYVGMGAPLEWTASIPGETDRKMTQATGEVCILGPRSIMVLPRLPGNQVIHYHMPRAAIRGMAEHWRLGQIDSLKSPVVRTDPVLHHLSRVMCRLREQPRASKATMRDQFLRSFYFHLLQHYGARSGAAPEFSGGLSPHHKRLVDDAFAEPSLREITIKYLADRCGFSAGHFARVFRQTFGRSFHQHVMKIRIQRAKELLRNPEISLDAVARTIGYADQATFTESFTRATRLSPGRFRRQHVVLTCKPNSDLI